MAVPHSAPSRPGPGAHRRHACHLLTASLVSMANMAVYTAVLDKRIRATKKKMEKIKLLEAKLSEGKDLDADQVAP